MKFDLSKRPMSWSSISSFRYDPEKWYKKYVLGVAQEDTAPLIFGKKVGEKLASDFTFLPQVPRLPIFEKKLVGKVGDINILGFLDAFQEKPCNFLEFKTSSNSKRWTQKTAEDHGQMLFYFALIWLNYGIAPEKIGARLVYIPCKENNSFEIELSGEPVQIFNVKKTSVDVLNFLNEIKRTYKEMEEYIKSYPQDVS